MTAEEAAAKAADAAIVAEQVAANAESRAALDAQERLQQFEGGLAECRAEIQSLRTLLTGMQEQGQSIQATLTRLSWLEEVEAMTTAKEGESESGEASPKSSGTDGSMSDGGDGKTSKPAKSSDAPARTPEGKDGDGKPAVPPEEKPSKESPARKRHRWL